MDSDTLSDDAIREAAIPAFSTNSHSGMDLPPSMDLASVE